MLNDGIKGGLVVNDIHRRAIKKICKTLSETEENQCKNAIRMVVDALKTIGFNESDLSQKMYSETPSFEVMMKSNDDYEVKIFTRILCKQY